ncbi:hypothetical protein C8R42DRAFT_644512 [Lentinula raphanica]|nr:hypothetical protein C8R42DRAFT_644512 [Lentinula raphanica]
MWAVPNYNLQELNHNEEQDEENEDADDNNEEGDVDVLDRGNDGTTYHVAKKPPIHVTVDSIRKEHDDWFQWYLDDFLYKNSFIENPNESPVTSNTPIPVYRQARIHLPSIPELASEESVDIIHATSAQPEKVTSKGVQPERPAKTSTVLVRIAKNDPKRGPLHGLQVARVHLIFLLPPPFLSKEPLIFVHLFKPFKDPVKDLELYQTSYSYQQHAKHDCTVLCSTQWMRTVHYVTVASCNIDYELLQDYYVDEARNYKDEIEETVGTHEEKDNTYGVSVLMAWNSPSEGEI